jgi:hypothetical protein
MVPDGCTAELVVLEEDELDELEGLGAPEVIA